jgi:hypothetical protein
MKEALAFFWLVWFIGLDLGGSITGTRFCINDPYPFFWF